MKNMLLKICALAAVPAVVLGASSCADKIELGANKSFYLEDDGVFPVVAAPYEQESRAAIDRWKGARNDEAVVKQVAAELYAYACYNEEYIDKYVYFSSQTGSTNIGSSSGDVTTQNYKLIINEGEGTPGYKYHYNIKKVNSTSGILGGMIGAFQSAALRFVVDTDKLYRFEGSDYRYTTDADGAETDVLTCDWTPGEKWGTDDPPIEKRAGEKLTLEQIEQDIIAIADDLDNNEPVIHCNVNILADNIIKEATITEGEVNGQTVYEVTIELDTEVANSDEASRNMLISANNPASKCDLVADEAGNGPTITYQIWENGLMKYYKMNEVWEGKLIFSGSADTQLEVWYSYSDRDTNITEKLEWLEEAKEKVEQQKA